VVAFFGPTDLAADFPTTPVDVPDLVHKFLGGTKDEKPDNYKAASPVTYVDKDDAPTLIYHGMKDRLVPFAQAEKMAEAMHVAGMAGRVELMLGADHGWGEPELKRTVDGTVAFFQQHLK
jgi:dipeptidyl aminopeptidase/acylaminoacyl peptidase